MGHLKLYLVSCVAVQLVCVVLGAYPTTYPYENELVVPPALPDATPNYKFDGTDPGGYVKNGLVDKTLKDSDFPWSWASFEYRDFFTAGLFTKVLSKAAADVGTFPQIPMTTWNCTARGDKALFYKATDFTGKLGDYTFACADTGCCKKWVGLYKDFDLVATVHDAIGTFLPSGGCDFKNMPEDVYCSWTDGGANACSEYYSTVSTRAVTEPCPNAYFAFVLTCPLFKTSGLSADQLGLDPKEYIAKMSVEQSVLHYAFWNTGDRLCHPLSYYNPEAGKTGAPGSGPSTPSPAGAIQGVLLSVLATAVMSRCF